MDDETRELIREVIGEGYETIIEEFESSVADAELTAELNRELAKELREQVIGNREAIIERIENAVAGNYRRRYELYDPETEREAVVQELNDTTLVEFVDRPELGEVVGGRTEGGRVAVVGPAGSGKTRLLCEAVREFEAGSVEHLLVPGEELLTPADVTDAFRRESFEGDVLLVWDDVHAVNPEQDNAVVRKVIRELEAILDEQGHALSVLVATRSENVRALPRDLRSGPNELSDEFDEVVLGELDETDLERLARRLLEAREERDDATTVYAPDEAVEALAERASGAESAPAYVDAVVTSTRGRLDAVDIESLPETATEVWEDEYTELRESDSAIDRHTWQVLQAFAVLHETTIEPIASLGRGIFEEVLEAGESTTTFRRTLERLVEWQWVDVPSEARGSEGSVREYDFVLGVHDTQLEAVGWEFDRQTAESVKEYLLESVSAEMLPEGLEQFRVAGQFVRNLDEAFGGLRREGYRELIEATDEGDQPELLATHHSNYAVLLEERGDRRVAARHYALAIRHQPDDATAHFNYAVLLQERGDRRVAARHYALALQHQPDYATAHANYGILLRRRGDSAVAIRHLRISTALWIREGRLDNAINDLTTLVKTCDESTEQETALKVVKRVLSLVQELDAELPGVQTRLKALRGRLSDDPIERARTRYDEGLQAVADEEHRDAISSFQWAWRLRNYFETPPASVLAAGVWLVAYDRLAEATVADEPEAVEEIASAHREDLPPVESSLYRTLFTDETGKAPAELEEQIEPNPKNDRALQAYATIIGKLSP